MRKYDKNFERLQKYQENKRTEKRMVCYNRKNKRKWRKQ